jgi:ABC-type transporter Mla subunit MlaD
LEGLLTIFVALTAIAVMTQAAVLVAIYIMSRRMTEQVERFMRDTRELVAPIKSITENLRAASANIVEIGMSARDQFRRVESMVMDTGDALNVQLARFDRVSQDVIERIDETTDIVQDSVLRPVREVAAIAKGISRGFEAFLFRRTRSTVDQARQDEELFI